MSNKVWFHLSNTSYSYGVSGNHKSMERFLNF
jgi:hypothetical protein